MAAATTTGANARKRAHKRCARVTIVGPFHWRQRHLHPCQGLCESNYWWYRKHGHYPKCKHSACFTYRGREYCQIHMGLILIKEHLK